MSSAERVKRSRWVNRLEDKADKLLELINDAPSPLPRVPVINPDLVKRLALYSGEEITEKTSKTENEIPREGISVTAQKVDTFKKRVTKHGLKGSTYFVEQKSGVYVTASSDHQDICQTILGEPTKESSLESYLEWRDVSSIELVELIHAISEYQPLEVNSTKEESVEQPVIRNYSMLVDDVRELVEKQAQKGKVITYASLAKKLEVIPPQLFKPLDELCRQSMEESNNQWMLSAYVVGENSKQRGLPSDGFFDLAVKLGLLEGGETLKQKYQFWIQHLTGTMRFYGENKQNSVVVAVVPGLKDSEDESKFFDTMRPHSAFKFIEREKWDNTEQYRAYICDKLPHRIYWDLLDPNRMFSGLKNAPLIEQAVGVTACDAIHWTNKKMAGFEFSDSELKLFIDWCSSDSNSQ